MKKRILVWSLYILLLTILLIAACILSLCLGTTRIPIKNVLSLLLSGKGSDIEHSIIFGIRLPRIILGIAVGSALSVSGVVLQSIFRNPLVEPYTLGISGGAALGVCLNLVLRLNQKISILSLPLSGFIGAICAIFAVYFLSIRRGTLHLHTMLLIGVMISFILSSLIMLIMAISHIEDLHGIILWTLGSLQEPNLLLVKITFAISIFGLFVSYLFSKELNALLLGEEEALHLGVDVEKTKRILFFLSSILTGCSVAVAGIIGFVGLVVPNFARMLFYGDHRVLLLSSALSGAAFLVVCDTIARMLIAPLELPIGVITGIIGGTVFVYFLQKRKK
jgi:iron complex transport system permease protein